MVHQGKRLGLRQGHDEQQMSSRLCLLPPPAAGALVGAITGLSAIPQRFIDGLARGDELRRLALQLAEQAFPEPGQG